MITCNSCNFLVNGNLKFSINSNQCPSCGSALLSNETLKQVNDLTSELFHNGFDYSRSELKLLSIFFVNKILKLNSGDFTDTNSEEESIDIGNEFEKIRNEIRQEVSADFDDNIETIEGESEDKVQRLQRLAKENKILNKRGTSVRRVTDD